MPNCQNCQEKCPQAEMAEYIEREAFINDIRNIHAKYGLKDNEEMLFSETDIIGIVECLPTVDVTPVRHGRWIPVTERLPYPGERVLATDGGFVGELYVNSRGQWQRYNVNDYTALMALDILWWMPLPEPPKEGAR